MPTKILVADSLAEDGLAILRTAGDVEAFSGLSEEDLIARIADADALVVRSGTTVTRAAIDAARRLRIIARAGVGVDNIDLDAATERGIIVVNSPSGNTIAAAEHAIAMLLALARNIPQAHASLKQGKWERSKFVGVEVLNKTLGIIGIGRIGSEVARRARGLGMKVIGCDPFVSDETAERLGVHRMELEELLQTSDFISLHTPRTPQTEKLLDARTLAKAKPGVRIINCARGGILDEEALCEAIKSGHVAGAALDVFEQEPPECKELLSLPQVIATPHLGASTREAQINVATDVAQQVVDVLAGRLPRTPVNLPPLSPEAYAEVEPYLDLAQRMGYLQACIMDGAPGSVKLFYGGSLAECECEPITLAFLKGFLQPLLGSPVSYVNARALTDQRGIRVLEERSPASADYAAHFSAQVEAERGAHWIVGAVFRGRDMRIINMDGDRIDVVPRGVVVFTRQQDRPGVIGEIGAILGRAKVNISGLQVGRGNVPGEGIIALSLDSLVSNDVLREIEGVAGVGPCWLVDFEQAATLTSSDDSDTKG